MQLEKFYITKHPGKFRTKEEFNMGLITNWYKQNGNSTLHTIPEILQIASEGHPIIPSHIGTEHNQIEFISSNLVFIDVDDDDKLTDPQQVLKELSDVCVGLFYTSSHSADKNRYRLLFVLNDYVRLDKRFYDFVLKDIVKYLNEKGIPADKQSIGADQRIRTAMIGHIVGNTAARYDINGLYDNYIEEQKETIRKYGDGLKNGDEYATLPVEVLKEMAEAIGIVDDRDRWINLGLSIKSYVHAGKLDDIDGLEVFNIICLGDETKIWNSFNPNKRGIGYFIQEAMHSGYKYNANGLVRRNNLGVSDLAERHKFEKYIPRELSKELIDAGQKILVRSPTGSGKTNSFVNGSKELSDVYLQQEKNHFFLFAVPTIAIADQVASSYDVMAVSGEVEESHKKIYGYVKNKGRVFTATYDQVPSLIEYLLKLKKNADYSIIIDEYHHFTHSYSFRAKAINPLYELRHSAKSFIGLSGTPEEILKDCFDREIHIETKFEKAPCSAWGAVTYKKKNEEEPLLRTMLRLKAESGRRCLVYIQNKKIIDSLADKLRSDGVKVVIVTSAEKDYSPAYKTIVDESIFPNNADIILTTSVLADGININNENMNYDCILVTSTASNMFNVDIARQCANRFRNPYRDFIVFMQEAKNETDALYHMEINYDYEKKLADNAVAMINEEFSDKGSHVLFRKSIIEKKLGLIFEDDNGAKYNELQLRLNVSQYKQRYYASFRNKFIEALGELMGEKANNPIDVTKLIEEKGISIEEMILILEMEAELAKENKLEQQAMFKIRYTEDIYNAFKEENEDILRKFKRMVCIEQYNCVEGICNIADYDTTKLIAMSVTNRKTTNVFRDKIQAAGDIRFWRKVDRGIPTRLVFNRLETELGKPFSTDELKALVKKVSQELKVSRENEVQRLVDIYFYHQHERDMRKRYTTLRNYSSEMLADEFELDVKVIEKCVYEQTKNMRKNVSRKHQSIIDILLKIDDIS